jgi:hypothetical protein
MKATKPAKPTKALAATARSVKDNDEFVAHVANIAARYRRAHALDSGPEARAMRQAMRVLHKQTSVLSQWLLRAQKVSPATPEANAYRRIKTALYGAAGTVIADDSTIKAWLSQAAKAAADELASSKGAAKSNAATPEAVRLAVEGLRATFEHHKLKWSATVTKSKQADAVRLLCAIAKQAGDAMTPHEARQWLLAKP